MSTDDELPYVSVAIWYIDWVVFDGMSTAEYHCLFVFVCISFMADGPQRAGLPIPPIVTLPSCLWPLRVFPSLPGSRLTNLYRDASSALLQLVEQ